MNGRFVFSEKDQKRMWREHMEKTMNKENAWDQKTKIGIVDSPVKEVSLEEITIAVKKMKLGKASRLSEVSTEMTNGSGKVGIDVMMKLCQRVLDGKRMSEDWKISVMVPIYKGKRDVTNWSTYRGVKLLEHGMKTVERVLEKRKRALVGVDDIKFGFLPGRETRDALFIVRRVQEESRGKDKKLYICFMDLEKAFNRVLRRVMQWTLRKKD